MELAVTGIVVFVVVLFVLITLIRTIVIAIVAYPVIANFGLRGICALAIADALLVLLLTHRASQRYFAVTYETSRLATLLALVLAFYVASLPTGMLSPYAGMFTKAILFAAFVAALYASRVLATDEKAWIRQQLRVLLLRSTHSAT